MKLVVECVQGDEHLTLDCNGRCRVSHHPSIHDVRTELWSRRVQPNPSTVKLYLPFVTRK